MANRARITILSMLAAVIVYLWIERNMPHLPPGSVYGAAAGIGFVVGVLINYILNMMGWGRK